jgi:hypothetical protein
MNQVPDPGWSGDTQWGGHNQWSNTPTSEFAAVSQGGYGGPPQKQGMSAGMAVLLTLMAVLILGLLAAVVVLFVPRMTGTTATSTTSTVSATATAAPSAAPVQPAQPAPAPAVSAPSGSYECTNTGGGFLSRSAVGSNVTSCEFASAVRSSYLSAGGDGGSKVVRAYSPVTGRSYTMSCSGGSVVTCTGGDNAVVYIY